jgi:hypothetical protein
MGKTGERVTNIGRIARGVFVSMAGLALCACSQSEHPKIGFLVEMPERGWFIKEQKAASHVGAEMGFRCHQSRRSGRREGAVRHRQSRRRRVRRVL